MSFSEVDLAVLVVGLFVGFLVGRFTSKKKESGGGSVPGGGTVNPRVKKK